MSWEEVIKLLRFSNTAEEIALLHDIGKPLNRCKGNKPDDSYSH